MIKYSIKHWKFDLLLISWKCVLVNTFFSIHQPLFLLLLCFWEACYILIWLQVHSCIHTRTHIFDLENNLNLSNGIESIAGREQVFIETGSNRIKKKYNVHNKQNQTPYKRIKWKRTLLSSIVPLAKRFYDNLNCSHLIYNQIYPLTPGQKKKNVLNYIHYSSM